MSRETLPGWVRAQLEPEVVRRRTHRGALVACGLFAFAVALSLLRPGAYAVGPVVIKFTSLRNPLLELGVAVLVALATAKSRRRFRIEVPSRVRGLWSASTPGGRVFALTFAAKLVVTAVGLARLPDQYLSVHRGALSRSGEPIEAVFARGDRYAQFERFFERCRQELPSGARVLYTGRTEGQLLSYVLYPRPVFMHPAERYVGWVGHQVLDLGRELPDDPLFPGALRPPLETPSLPEFVESRRITHEVRFVASDLPSCRIVAIR